MKLGLEPISPEITTFYDDQPEEKYEASHKKRLDFLVKDLELDKISDAIIGDFGCGYGAIFKRLPRDRGNRFIGFDAANLNPKEFCYIQADLSRPLPIINYQLDVALCFETIEHLTNPYNLLYEIKRLLKPEHILHLSIPAEGTEHNTIYPALLYPERNFEEFLEQMAFNIIDKRYHNKNFSQHVFKLQNLPWHRSKLRFPLREQKYFNLPPHMVVNI